MKDKYFINCCVLRGQLVKKLPMSTIVWDRELFFLLQIGREEDRMAVPVMCHAVEDVLPFGEIREGDWVYVTGELHEISGGDEEKYALLVECRHMEVLQHEADRQVTNLVLFTGKVYGDVGLPKDHPKCKCLFDLEVKQSNIYEFYYLTCVAGRDISQEEIDLVLSPDELQITGSLVMLETENLPDARVGYVQVFRVSRPKDRTGRLLLGHLRTALMAGNSRMEGVSNNGQV